MLGVRRATVTEAASALQRAGAHPVPPRRGLDRGPARAGSRDVRVLPDRAGGVRPAARSARRMSVGDGHRARRGRREHGADAGAADAGARGLRASSRPRTARSALRLIERGQPAIDVVLTDLVMPGIDGFDIITVLAAPPPGPAGGLHVGLRLGVGEPADGSLHPEAVLARGARAGLEPCSREAASWARRPLDGRRERRAARAVGASDRAPTLDLVAAALELRRQRAGPPGTR